MPVPCWSGSPFMRRVFITSRFPWPFCGVAVSLLGVFGDLIESRIKRGVGVKDSGNLIPAMAACSIEPTLSIFGCITAYLILSIGGVI